MRVAVAVMTLASSGLYVASEAMELAAGGFSRPQLCLTYVAFALVPFAALGLHALQHAVADWTSLVGAAAYGLAYVFYAGTALYALAAGTDDYAALVRALGGIYVVHGVLMIAGAAGALVFTLLELPADLQVVPSVIRAAAFAGMAIAALR